MFNMDFPDGSDGKKKIYIYIYMPAMQCRRLGFDPWVGKIFWRREFLENPTDRGAWWHGVANHKG